MEEGQQQALEEETEEEEFTLHERFCLWHTREERKHSKECKMTPTKLGGADDDDFV